MISDRKKLKNYYLLIFSIMLTVLLGCSSSKTPEIKSAENLFNEAMEKFKKEDYQEATTLFDIVKLQYPASTYAADAQYYLAEIYYKKGDYLQAVFSYNSLRRNYPSSPHYKESLFKTGMSYFELSLPYDRDQEYTQKAIDAFQNFQRAYPNDSLYIQATKYIEDSRDKLAHRDFFNAELYRKLFNPEAAIVYYDSVIDNYPDTQYYEPAFFNKIEALVDLKKYEDALGICDLYIKIFPQGKHLDNVKNIKNMMPRNR